MERRKFVIGMGALTTGAAASIGTGAFTTMQAGGRESNIDVVVDENALIGLKAGPTDLVTGTSDGQLEIDFDVDDAGDGVNPNSTYQVGGLGGVGDLHHLIDQDTSIPTVQDVAVDTETPIKEEYAFKIMNQSGEDRAVQLTYEVNDDEPFPDDAVIYMVALAESTPQGRTVLATAAQSAREGTILFTDDDTFSYSRNLKSGEKAYVTLLVDVGDAEPVTDIGGEIVVKAGSHDEFIDEDVF